MSAADTFDTDPDDSQEPSDFAGTIHVIVVGINSDHTLQQVSPGTNHAQQAKAHARLAKGLADVHADGLVANELIHMLTTGDSVDEARLLLSPIVYSIHSTPTITDRVLYHQQVWEVNEVVNDDDETETPDE